MEQSLQMENQVTVRDEQRQLPLVGLTVEEGVMTIQLIERLVTAGKLVGQELFPIGVLREKFVAAIANATRAGQPNSGAEAEAAGNAGENQEEAA
jgi:hypothetical protein